MKNKKEPFYVGNGLISRNHLDEICIKPLAYEKLVEYMSYGGNRK